MIFLIQKTHSAKTTNSTTSAVAAVFWRPEKFSDASLFTRMPAGAPRADLLGSAARCSIGRRTRGHSPPELVAVFTLFFFDLGVVPTTHLPPSPPIYSSRQDAHFYP
ncbi:hypothetical protein Salat_2726500, partial [Sesamum alatum]